MPVPVPPVAFIESLGGGEIMLVLVVALMLFGGDKLPELARGLGKSMREFKKATGAMQDELKRAMEEVEAPPPTIMPPSPASPEIKSTPGIQPPGAETPGSFTDDSGPTPGSDPFIDHHAADPVHGEPESSPGIGSVEPLTPPAVLPAATPSAPPAPVAETKPPEPRPNAGTGAAV